jgi:hypothetical protein
MKSSRAFSGWTWICPKISSIEAKADEHVIEGALVHFQRNQLYKSTKPLNLRKLAQRAVVAVKAA